MRLEQSSCDVKQSWQEANMSTRCTCTQVGDKSHFVPVEALECLTSVLPNNRRCFESEAVSKKPRRTPVQLFNPPASASHIRLCTSRLVLASQGQGAGRDGTMEKFTCCLCRERSLLVQSRIQLLQGHCHGKACLCFAFAFQAMQSPRTQARQL